MAIRIIFVDDILKKLNGPLDQRGVMLEWTKSEPPETFAGANIGEHSPPTDIPKYEGLFSGSS